jgi:hypothetical protein
MKLYKLFENLILELTASEIRDKYYSEIDEPTFNKIVLADPKTKQKGDKIKKIGKYAKVLLDMYKKGNLKLEDLPKATEYLGIIYAKQIPLNMKSVKGLSDIYNMVKDHIISKGETDINKLINSLEKDDYKLLFNGDRWLIFQPKTEKGACTLGSGTQWCTTWGKYSTEPSYKDRRNRFDDYDKRGVIYTLIDKKDNANKYQFHVESNQFMDKTDRMINVSNFLDNHNEVLLFFNPELKGDLTEISDDKLEEMVGRKLITNEAKKEVIGALVERNKDKDIINIFLEAQRTGEYDKINQALDSNDFEIVDIPEKGIFSIEFKSLEDNDLRIYDQINNSYYDYDPYLDEEEAKIYYDNSIDEIWRKSAKNLEREFKEDEGLDIKKFLAERNIAFDVDFLKGLLNDSGKLDSFLEGINDVIYNAMYEANSEARDTVYNKASGFFEIWSNEINLNIFKLFLIRYNEYSMEDFKEFLNYTFDIPVEDYEIYEDIRELEYTLLNVDINEIVRAYDNIQSALVEWFMEYYEDEIEEFKSVDTSYLKKNHNEVYNKLIKIMSDLKFDISKGNEFENDIVKVKVDFSKIRPTKDEIYMDVTNKEKGTTNSGYIKLDDIGTQFTNYKLFEEIKRYKGLL